MHRYQLVFRRNSSNIEIEPHRLCDECKERYATKTCNKTENCWKMLCDICYDLHECVEEYPEIIYMNYAGEKYKLYRKPNLDSNGKYEYEFINTEDDERDIVASLYYSKGLSNIQEYDSYDDIVRDDGWVLATYGYNLPISKYEYYFWSDNLFGTYKMLEYSIVEGNHESDPLYKTDESSGISITIN